MGDNSKIEWTDASWNPVVGCSKVSQGCKNCYAMKVAHRNAAMGIERYKGLTEKRLSGVEWNGVVRCVPEVLDVPLKWKRPRKIFVNSMSDLFHEDVPFEFIDRVYDTMLTTGRHTYQILTKRPWRMLEYYQSRTFGGLDMNLIRNIWIGVSVEDQGSANERVPVLLQVPAAVHWLSCEPLLAPVELTRLDILDFGTVDALRGISWSDGRNEPWEFKKIDWVVVGGESGGTARHMDPEWVKELYNECMTTGVPFYFKQWGAWDEYGKKVGKKKAGRLLFGRTWDEMPAGTNA